MRKLKTERSWLLALFGLPFFAVGVGVLFFMLIPSLYDGWRMASWPSTPGTLSHAELISSTSDGSTTYRVEARYHYRVDGAQYSNDRVAISSSGDNIGDFQQQLGRRLERQLHNRQPVAVYYNPHTPADSTLDRSMRWGLLGLKAVFVLAFGGVGFGLIFFALRGVRRIDSPESATRPWLQRIEWADNRIRSTARSGLYFAWGFALFWNLVSAPVAFMFQEIWEQEGNVALLMLLFPLIGVFLLLWAVRKTLEWRRFGATPLRLEPFPGAINGDVAGEVVLNIPFDPQLVCEVSLSSIHSYVSGSGKNRSRHERVEWQDSGYARVERAAKGVRLVFRFEVPDGLHESEEHSDNYYLWRLTISAEMPGTDLNRDFEIPVYRTAKRSRTISVDSANEVPHGVKREGIEGLLPVRRSGGVLDIYYPMLRRPGRALAILLFGGVFTGAGLFMWGEAARTSAMLYVMSAIFSLVGALVVLGGLYSAFNSLRVEIGGGELRTVRRLLGIPVRRYRLAYNEISAIEEKRGASSTQQGGRHHIEYSVVAKSRHGELVLAEHITSHSKVKRVVDFFKERLGV